jgi:hypothetical protein
MPNSTSLRATLRQGMALPIALAAIVAVGALIAGVFFASTQEYRVGRNSLATQQAMQAAEVGLSSIVSSWTPARTNATRVGNSVTLANLEIDGVTVQRQYTRVSPTTFWVTATAIKGGGALEGRAVKRLNTIIRIETPDFKIMGAVTARGTISASGATTISGTDSLPAGWDCPPGGGGGANAGIVGNAATTTGTGANCAGFACVSGSPKVLDSAAMVADTMNFTKFGGMSYDSLTRLATKVRTAGGTIGTVGPRYLVDDSCDIANVDNWGDTSHVDPREGCDSYFPVVHLQGPTLSYLVNGGGGGQGIMLVDGNLSVAGNFKWTGLIIVRGTFSIAGTGGGSGTKIIGAVAAMNRGAGTNSFAGNSSVTFSKCAVDQVTSRLANASLLRHRAWADLSF